LGGKTHRLFRRDNKEKLLPDLHYRNTAEMLEEFSFLKDDILIKEIVIDNTYIFNDEVEKNIYPLRTKLEPPKIAGVDEKLKEVVYQRAMKLYGKDIPKNISERIERELNLIIEKNYAIIY
jgi:DNA polymerase-3 subunit alpha (Gram-positive type)